MMARSRTIVWQIGTKECGQHEHLRIATRDTAHLADCLEVDAFATRMSERLPYDNDGEI